MINWSEASTKRNAVWVATFIIGIPMAFMGKDVSQLLLLGGGIAGAMGVYMSDSSSKKDDKPE